ncbi:hypothetical protein CsSME_00039086 [Camellia sinensis var. sinensis]
MVPTLGEKGLLGQNEQALGSAAQMLPWWLEGRRLFRAVGQGVLFRFEPRRRSAHGRSVAHQAVRPNLDADSVARRDSRGTNITRVSTTVVMMAKKIKPGCPYQLFHCSS